MMVDGAPKSRPDCIAYLAIIVAGKNLPVLRELTAKRSANFMSWFFILQ